MEKSFYESESYFSRLNLTAESKPFCLCLTQRQLKDRALFIGILKIETPISFRRERQLPSTELESES